MYQRDCGCPCYDGGWGMITQKEICLSYGVTDNAVYAHMKRKDLSFYDALECAMNCKKARDNFKPKNKETDFLIKKRLNKEAIIECEKLGLTYLESAKVLKVPYMTLVSRINKMGINWRGKGRQIGAKQ